MLFGSHLVISNQLQNTFSKEETANLNTCNNLLDFERNFPETKLNEVGGHFARCRPSMG